MSSAKLLIETHRNGAETYKGITAKDKLYETLEEFSFPRGLLHVGDIEEFGINRSTGFIWIKLADKCEHKYASILQTVMYAVEITAFIENRSLKDLKGVKAKELLIPVVITEIQVGVPSPDLIYFKSIVGLGRAQPVSAFEIEENI